MMRLFESYGLAGCAADFTLASRRFFGSVGTSAIDACESIDAIDANEALFPAGVEIAFPAAEFPVSVSIADKFLSTVLAVQPIIGFALPLFGVDFPPAYTADIRAKPFLPMP